MEFSGSDSNVQEALKLLDVLGSEYSKDPCDLEACLELLKKLKHIIPFFKSAPPTPTEYIEDELVISRDTLEFGALVAVRCNDIDSFERYISQLSAYYIDLSEKIWQESKRKHLILGMYLIHLLSVNRIGDFHFMVELINEKDKENAYLKYAIMLERHLMDGNYHEVLVAYENVPDPLYTFFMEALTSTVRLKVAASLEKAYTSIDAAYASRLLLLDSVKDLYLFATAENQRKAEEGNSVMWSVVNDRLCFKSTESRNPGIVPIDHIDKLLGYATELERII